MDGWLFLFSQFPRLVSNPKSKSYIVQLGEDLNEKKFFCKRLGLTHVWEKQSSEALRIVHHEYRMQEKMVLLTVPTS